MYSTWKIVGQVGNVRKAENGLWKLDVAQNRYEGSDKLDTTWFNLLVRFEPRCEVGDRVVVCGRFEDNTNKGSQYPFAMVAQDIGVITPLDRKTFTPRDRRKKDVEVKQEDQED